jgi:signal transduction histidine kinase
MAEHALRRQRVTVKQRLDPAVGMLRCDAGQLKQVLLNLFLNAVQAMPQGGELTVTVSLQSNPEVGRSWARIAVQDTGCGIEPANLSRIFDPFYTTREEGTGLGLAIVHGIVDAHKGRVEVDSRPGKGSTFTVVLPLAGQEGALERERAGVTPQRALNIC